ncbi:MAG: cob(I)yrinic acid a,c-diamide adenosyltransferase [Sphingobacteriaceae bacterium]|nr:cob(I)yrinic acid a,c-diamide adenosyltransferase [Cytophagaceae bacterium]
MKIYTKTGDTGSTALISGRRVPKSDLRIDSYGTVDELNAYVGLVRDQPVNASRRGLLKEIQDRLFTMGALLATDPEKAMRKPIPDLFETDVELLEREMDGMDAHLPELRHFILPGGHEAVSVAHLARTVCRRAERLVVALDQEQPVEPLVIRYLNRLSDYLFVLSRKMAQELGAEEIKWEPRVTK